MMNKIVLQDEILCDEQLDQVVGGVMTAYVFFYMKDGNQVHYFKEPLAVGFGSWGTLYSNIKTAYSAFVAKDLLQQTNLSNFNEICQDYADKKASQWANPMTYGNVVLALCVENGSGLLNGVPNFSMKSFSAS